MGTIEQPDAMEKGVEFWYDKKGVQIYEGEKGVGHDSPYGNPNFEAHDVSVGGQVSIRSLSSIQNSHLSHAP